MIDFLSAVTIVGTVASVAGALVSYLQAKRSKQSANEAEKAKQQIFIHQGVSNFSLLNTLCNQAESAMKKYGPAAAVASLDGITPEADAAKVQEFVYKTRSFRTLFGEGEDNAADVFYNKMVPLLENFSEAPNSDERKRYGTDILKELSLISGLIREQLAAQKMETN